jgi:hypothetical protein
VPNEAVAKAYKKAFVKLIDFSKDTCAEAWA